MGHSTTPAGVALQSHVYLAQGGVENLRQLHAFLCDTLLMTGFGFAPPVDHPELGCSRARRRRMPRPDDRGAVLPRPAPCGQHRLRRGAVPRHRGRGRPAAAGVLRVVAHRGRRAARAARHRRRVGDHGAGRGRVHPGHRHGGRQRRHLERRAPGRARHPDPAGSVPDQFAVAVAATTTTGMSPLDVATQVAVPEFDGRIITVPFSFKEIDDEGLISYVADPERCARVAGLAVRHARLRAIPAAAEAGGAGVLGLSHQARPHRQRRRPGHPGQRGRAAARHARRTDTRSTTFPASTRRTATP